MQDHETRMDSLLLALKERAKELNCLYEVEELFSRPGISLTEIMDGVALAIPAGWQYPDVCEARIVFGEISCSTARFRETPWTMSTDLVIQDEVSGRIDVCYTEERPESDEGPFLKEERKLIETIADRLERRILHENLRNVFEDEQRRTVAGVEWRVILGLLRKTDPKLLTRITRKMLNHLAWSGVDEANLIIEGFSASLRGGRDGSIIDENRPVILTSRQDLLAQTDRIFTLASERLSEDEILSNIQKWIKEDRSGFLVRILENPQSTLGEITNAIERFHHLASQGLELSFPRERAFRVSLIRRLLSDDSTFIGIAKRFIDVNDFYDLLRRVIHPTGSHGKLGGKASGLFLASQVLRAVGKNNELLSCVKTPKTWYLTSDGILNFIDTNDLEEIIEQKYEDIGHVRQEYPYIVHVFRNSPLPPEIINGLSVALDDFGDTPLIVRSSSLLEDRIGASFAGMYKSLFIANQGTKRERLVALMDAITEVYASTFGPDPIEYRSEHGLVDFHEEMGVLIQEVAGTRVGKYFMPAFAGVAFSNNEFRWSRRIKREDGLARMVPGLGTRAVDRMSDDYPVLIAPGQPTLRVNVTTDEKVRYSPRKADVINLETNELESVDVRDLMRECGNDFPLVQQLVSLLRDDRLEQVTGLGFDPDKDHVVVTFEGLVTRTRFLEQIRTILDALQAEFHMPVDIEFAHDGKDLYLVQCRPQSYGSAAQPATIPHDLDPERVIFTANRYVSNGTVSGITHIVYVDPLRYAELSARQDLLNVGRAISRLNEILPKRQFILMGPGRWGSRGDIRLGVSVTYSDINASAMLMEIARKQKDYVPELSFGTHFFQDLVEASIRYLPLYPDEKGIVFNEAFLQQAENILPTLLPELGHLSKTIRVIDVPRSTGGHTLQILMNGETDEAVGFLTDAPISAADLAPVRRGEETSMHIEDTHWKWRLRMVERLASLLDPKRFAVKALYLFGSTKNATAGPDSDIDLLIHFTGSEGQRRDLLAWLEGWSLSLAEVNFLRTGRRLEGLLDAHIITDDDVMRRTSFASKIGAATDAARPLPMGSRVR
ncbi:MAG: nucleotidyltransferase domain-containing protein [Acidobacteria bacterium]|nr:nucleotidyltransferase domain-containing protein [Acidobacteriota bacterium]